MIRQPILGKRIRRAVLLCVTACLLTVPFYSPVSLAGEQAVYVNDSAYFTLENVELSSGAESQMLRFTLELVNNSDQAIDYNNYGVRVVDSNGSSFSAQLSEKGIARVQPNRTQAYKYISQISSDDPLDQLKVDIFAWDSGADNFMRDIGALTLSTASNSTQVQKQQAVLNISPIDAALPDDALVAFELNRSYKVLKDGNWYLYADLLAQNLGQSSFKLPAGLVLELKDGNGLVYSAQVVYGGDQTLLPEQPNLITLQSMISDKFNDRSFTLLFLQKNQNDLINIGSMNMSGSLSAMKIGDAADYAPKLAGGLKVTVDKVTYATRTDGVAAEATVTLRNSGKETVAVPGLSASFQVKRTGATITAADATSHPAYLSPDGSTTYRFRGTLPPGTDMGDAELVLMDKKTGNPALSTPVAVATLSGAVSATAGASAMDPQATLVSTSAGALELKVNRTQRVMTDGDDVLLSEIVLRNVSGSIVSLPPMYGGYHLGSDSDVDGKVLRIQSSPLLSPYQETTVYLFTNIPYSYSLASGELFLGEGTIQTQGSGQNKTDTFTKTQEWARLAFRVDTSDAPVYDKGQEWQIDEMGWQSSASIIDSSIYDVGNQKMIAVRILQNGKATRGGSIVPYGGYFLGPDGSIWPAKTTDEQGRLCQGCAAMSTLWFTLPEAKSYATTDYKLLFGEKLDDTAIAGIRQYNVPATGTHPAVESVPPINETKGYTINIDADIGPIDLYPYQAEFHQLSVIRKDSSNKFEISFYYDQGKAADIIAGNKNRGLQIVLKDNLENVMQTWDFPFEGKGALQKGLNKLTADLTGMDTTNIWPARIYINEKFEDGVRQVGSNISLATGSE